MADRGSSYSERLTMPVSWAVAVLVVAVLAALELDGGGRGWLATGPYLTLLPLAAAWLVFASRQQVRVADGVLHVHHARAPLECFGSPEVLTGEELRVWLGPRAERDAWVSMRPWLRSAVRLPVVDSEDDTPYWLIGTRHPGVLVAAITGGARA